jgi:hypothetical protein
MTPFIMKLLTQITCDQCGTSHRIRRPLGPSQKYRFVCKSCGAEITFRLASVRWEVVGKDREVDEGKRTVAFSREEAAKAMADAAEARGRDAERLPARPAPVETKPPAAQPARAPSPCRDTVLDERVPLHLTPLLRAREITHRERESSRVRWLRAALKTQPERTPLAVAI